MRSNITCDVWRIGLSIVSITLIVVIVFYQRLYNRNFDSIVANLEEKNDAISLDLICANFVSSAKLRSRFMQDKAFDLQSLRDTQASIFPIPKITVQHEKQNNQKYLLQLHESYRITTKKWDDDSSKLKLKQSYLKSFMENFCSKLHANAISFAGNQDLLHHQLNISILQITEIEIHIVSMRYFYEKINRLLNVNHVEIQSNEVYALHLLPCDETTSRIPTGIMQIHTNSIYGINHALASLSQLLHMPVLHSMPMEIIDWPDRRWRGLMLDVSRHFIPIQQLYRLIDGMHSMHSNTLHLHLSDADSFPLLFTPDTYLLEKYAFNLTELSLYSMHDPTVGEKIYTAEQLKALVTYASKRGIEVIPEIDVPAHTYSWGNVFLQLASGSSSSSKSYSHNVTDIIARCDHLASISESPLNIYPLNPSQPFTFDLIYAIFQQVSEIFSSPYLHVGGDEVDTRCYEEVPSIHTWMQSMSLTSSNITKYIEDRVIAMVYKLAKIPIVWQGIIDSNSLPNDQNVGQTRRRLQQQSMMSNTIAHGQRSLLSTSASSQAQPLLLTASINNDKNNNNHKVLIEPWKCWGGLASRAAVHAIETDHYVWMAACMYLDYNSDWTTFLALNTIGEAEQQLNVPARQHEHEDYFLGGEGCMWTESVDHTNLECRVWPRAAAIGSSLWGFYTENQCHDGDHHSDHSNNETTAAACYFNPVLLLRSNTTSASSHTSYSNGDLHLSLEYTKLLYSSYVIYRYYLEDQIQLSPAPITFHLSDEMMGNPSTASTSANSQHHRSTKRRSMVTAAAAAGGKQSMNNTRLTTTRRGYKSEKSSMRFRRSLMYSTADYTPYIMQNMTAALRLINTLDEGIVISSRGPDLSVTTSSSSTFTTASLYNQSSQQSSHHHRAVWMTSQCLGIPHPLQRPVHIPLLSVVQLNIADGSLGQRGEAMLAWLQSKARQGVIAVGFCELVGWQQLYSKTELVKNLPWLALRAANAGYVYSYISTYSTQSSYPIGLIALYPFTVLKEYTYPDFQRCVIHAYIPKVHLHIIVVHLHAHDASQRLVEAQFLLKNVLQPLLIAQEKVIVMGDFNTLSPVDQGQHDYDHLVQTLHRKDNEVFIRWKKKFLTPTGDVIDYRPMQTFLDAGMKDSCVESCCQRISLNRHTASLSPSCHHLSGSSNNNKYNVHWSVNQTDAFSVCMQTYCKGSEPTDYKPEWPTTVGMDHPLIRLDFILMSLAVLYPLTTSVSSINGTMTSSYRPVTAHNEELRIEAGIEINNITNILSDHYPAYAKWKDPSLEDGLDLF